MTWMWIFKFMLLQVVAVGVIIFTLRNVFVSQTEGAVKRLNRETEEARAKQTELDQKIKAANEELEKRKKEADELTKKMLEKADKKAKAERDEIVKKARFESEEIIAKAQRTKDQMRSEVKKEVELKMITYAGDLLSKVLSEKARGLLNQQLSDEFIASLTKVDMTQIGKDIETAEIIVASTLPEDIKKKISDIIKEKLGRTIDIKTTVDPQVIGGVVLRFGSLALDASLQNLITETSVSLKEGAEGA
ncbi:MAG: F0F1 ATP synthase subunit delta [Candidatus Omnitrophota bacterium]